VSARLAKTAVAALGDKAPDEVELCGTGSRRPTRLFAWIEGRAEKPVSVDPAPFRPVMLSHAIEETDFAALDPADFSPNGNGTASACRRSRRSATASAWRGSIRAPARTFRRFPDLIEALDFDGAIDGELLILRDGRVQSFNVLQQRLNRKTVNAKLLAEFPRALCAPTTCCSRTAKTCASCPSCSARARLETLIGKLDHARIDISPLVPFANGMN
jgi:DNA ligase-1